MRKTETLRLLTQSISQGTSTLKAKSPVEHLVGSLLPKVQQASFFTMRALNLELEESFQRAAEPAQRRLLWWRDHCSKLHEAPAAIQEHPLSFALHYTMHKGRLPLDLALAPVNGYIALVSGVRTLPELESSVQQIHSSMLEVDLHVANEVGSDAKHAAVHLGISYGLLRYLSVLSTAFLSGHKIHDFLPHALVQEHCPSDSPDAIQKGYPEICYTIASTAMAHYEHGQFQSSHFPLMQILCKNMLRHFEQQQFALLPYTKPTLRLLGGLYGHRLRTFARWN